MPYQQEFPNSGAMGRRGVSGHEKETMLDGLKDCVILDEGAIESGKRFEPNGQERLQTRVELILDSLHELEEKLPNTQTVLWSLGQLGEDQIDEA